MQKPVNIFKNNPLRSTKHVPKEEHYVEECARAIVFAVELMRTLSCCICFIKGVSNNREQIVVQYNIDIRKSINGNRHDHIKNGCNDKRLEANYTMK